MYHLDPDVLKRGVQNLQETMGKNRQSGVQKIRNVKFSRGDTPMMELQVKILIKITL